MSHTFSSGARVFYSLPLRWRPLASFSDKQDKLSLSSLCTKESKFFSGVSLCVSEIASFTNFDLTSLKVNESSSSSISGLSDGVFSSFRFGVYVASEDAGASFTFGRHK